MVQNTQKQREKVGPGCDPERKKHVQMHGLLLKVQCEGLRGIYL